jgi:hypothetical protein
VRTPVIASFLLLGACSGGGDPTTPPAPACDDLQTAALGTISVEEWPAGTNDSLSIVERIDGRYKVADSCQPGVQSYVKLLLANGAEMNREAVQLVTQPYSESPCGCTTDDAYGPDSDYTLVGVHDPSTFFLEDPWFVDTTTGADANVTVDIPLVIFGESSLVARSCSSYNIEPFQSGVYDSLDLVFRIEAGGVFSATYSLVTVDGEAGESCEITDFVKDANE